MISAGPFMWLNFSGSGPRSHANTMEDVWQRVVMKRNNSRAESLLILQQLNHFRYLKDYIA